MMNCTHIPQRVDNWLGHTVGERGGSLHCGDVIPKSLDDREEIFAQRLLQKIQLPFLLQEMNLPDYWSQLHYETRRW